MLGQGLQSLIPPSKKGEGDSFQKDSVNDSAPQTSALPEEGVGSDSVGSDSLEHPLIEEQGLHSVPLPGGESVSVPHGEAQESDYITSGQAIFHIEVGRIHPNPYQPRREFDNEKLRELAESIREYGIIQPLVVSRIQKEVDSGSQVEYQIIAGERRYRAALMVGLPMVPVVIRRAETPKGNIEVALVENLQRSDLNPLETARAYSRLQEEFGLTQREVAQRVGKSREAVANTLRLLSLPTYIQEAIQGGTIHESQARILLGIPDMERQKKTFEQLLEGKLSVRGLKERVKSVKNDPEKNFYERQLEEKIGAPVEISKRGDKGKVIIRFFSNEEMQEVLGRLLGEME